MQEHDPTIHRLCSYASMVDVARQKLKTLIGASNTDSIRIQKIMPSLERNKCLIREMANRARALVGTEVVELVNAIIRRGNDLITAIDQAEEGKLYQFSKAENEMKITHEKLKKVNFFFFQIF